MEGLGDIPGMLHLSTWRHGVAIPQLGAFPFDNLSVLIVPTSVDALIDSWIVLCFPFRSSPRNSESAFVIKKHRDLSGPLPLRSFQAMLCATAQ
ncbi:hypothetical protein CEXT_589071 [Caerostris extrusa]|uniref:Uncharacterized protein n=1 Tax=Caerostris extrusa TaxID=172846 RepID=A0AAV4UJ94_CAEEX|nr:hypothetical protein CEXT_589071 [Caerostris extrusa]